MPYQCFDFEALHCVVLTFFSLDSVAPLGVPIRRFSVFDGSLARNGDLETSRATLSSLWAVSDGSGCGAVSILAIKEILYIDLGKEVLVFYPEVAQRSCHGDLLWRSCTETLQRDLLRSCQ